MTAPVRSASRLLRQLRGRARARGARLLARMPRPVRQGWRLLHRTWRETFDDRVPGLAAETALFTLLSLPALLLVILGSLGFIAETLGPDGRAEMQRLVFDLPRALLSARTYDSYQEIASQVVRDGRGDVISIGLVVSLWTGSRATNRYLETITIAYDLEDPRPVWHRRLLSLGLTIGVLVSAVAILPPLVVGPRIVRWLTPAAVEETTLTLIGTLFWPGVVALVILGVASLYHLGVPRHTPWRRDLPGAVLAVVLFLLASGLLRTYVEVTAREDAVYTRIGTLIAVVLWLYVIALAVLLGAEFNAELEKLWPHERHPWRLGGRWRSAASRTGHRDRPLSRGVRGPDRPA